MTNPIESLVTNYDRGVITRRQLLTALSALAATSVAAAETENKEPAFEAKSLNHVTLSVSNVEKSRRFYSLILGAPVISEQKNGINLGLGSHFLAKTRLSSSKLVNPRATVNTASA